MATAEQTAAAQAVLDKGNALGAAASKQTGVPYTPVGQTNTTSAPAAPVSTNTAASPQSDFLNQLQQKLLSQSDIISSEPTNIENKINEAIQGVQKGNEASAAAVTSAFDRAKGQAAEQGAANLTGQLESQRGFAQNTAILDKIQKDTDTNLKDLEQRKQELILQGNSAAAGQISQLQMQAIQMRQQAQQQVFQNLLGLANFGMARDNAAAEQYRFDKQFSYQERSDMSKIAAQYGLAMQPGDTLETLIQRAAPYATEKQKLELESIKADIANSKAQTAKAWSDMQKGEKSYDIDAIARASLKDPSILALIDDIGTASKVVNAAAGLWYSDTLDEAKAEKANGSSKTSMVNKAKTTYAQDPIKLQKALQALDEVYGATPPPKYQGKTTADIFLDSVLGGQSVLGGI